VFCFFVVIRLSYGYIVTGWTSEEFFRRPCKYVTPQETAQTLYLRLAIWLSEAGAEHSIFASFHRLFLIQSTFEAHWQRIRNTRPRIRPTRNGPVQSTRSTRRSVLLTGALHGRVWHRKRGQHYLGRPDHNETGASGEHRASYWGFPLRRRGWDTGRTPNRR